MYSNLYPYAQVHFLTGMACLTQVLSTCQEIAWGNHVRKWTDVRLQGLLPPERDVLCTLMALAD